MLLVYFFPSVGFLVEYGLYFIDDIKIYRENLGSHVLWSKRVLLLVKEKLAHNFMVSYLVLISCLTDMVRTFVTDTNTQIAIILLYLQGKEKNIPEPLDFGFPNQSLCYVIRGGIPWNYKGISLFDNPMYANSNYKEK